MLYFKGDQIYTNALSLQPSTEKVNKNSKEVIPEKEVILEMALFISRRSGNVWYDIRDVTVVTCCNETCGQKLELRNQW